MTNAASGLAPKVKRTAADHAAENAARREAALATKAGPKLSKKAKQEVDAAAARADFLARLAANPSGFVFAVQIFTVHSTEDVSIVFLGSTLEKAKDYCRKDPWEGLVLEIIPQEIDSEYEQERFAIAHFTVKGDQVIETEGSWPFPRYRP